MEKRGKKSVDFQISKLLPLRTFKSDSTPLNLTIGFPKNQTRALTDTAFTKIAPEKSFRPHFWTPKMAFSPENRHFRPVCTRKMAKSGKKSTE